MQSTDIRLIIIKISRETNPTKTFQKIVRRIKVVRQRSGGSQRPERQWQCNQKTSDSVHETKGLLRGGGEQQRKAEEEHQPKAVESDRFSVSQGELSEGTARIAEHSTGSAQIRVSDRTA